MSTVHSLQSPFFLPSPLNPLRKPTSHFPSLVTKPPAVISRKSPLIFASVAQFSAVSAPKRENDPKKKVVITGMGLVLCLAMMSMLTMRNCFPARAVIFRLHLLKHQHLLLVNRLKDLEKFLCERVTNSLEILQLIQSSSVPIPFNPILLSKLQKGNHNKQLAIPCSL